MEEHLFERLARERNITVEEMRADYFLQESKKDGMTLDPEKTGTVEKNTLCRQRIVNYRPVIKLYILFLNRYVPIRLPWPAARTIAVHFFLFSFITLPKFQIRHCIQIPAMSRTIQIFIISCHTYHGCIICTVDW